jgi:dolichol-phosphate mannosyltransferase
MLLFGWKGIIIGLAGAPSSMTSAYESMKAIVVIPTYNERENLRKLADSIRRQNLPLDILFVDDNSPDGTGRLAEELAAADPRIKVLHRPKKQGLGRAYLDGFRWVLENGYDVILQMDADLSHDPNTLPDFLEKIKDHDAVFGSRYYKGVRVYNWSFKRLLMSKLSNEFIRLMLRIESTDTTTAFKCFRKEVLESIRWRKLRGRQNAFLIDLVYKVIKSGFKTTEIPFVFKERETGESKMQFRVALESLLMVARLMFANKRQLRRNRKKLSQA